MCRFIIIITDFMNTLDKLFELLLEKTGLKRVAGRPYGHIHYSPNSAIAVRVKKKSISIEFYTDGGSKNSLTTDEHIKWANESGILRRELFSGGFFVLRRGVKNNLKSTLIYELSIDSEDSLSNQDLLYELVGVINGLKQDLDKSKERRIDSKEAELVSEESNSSNQGGQHFYLMRIGISGYFDSDDFEDDLEHAVTKSADMLLHHGLLLKERGIQTDCFYVVGKKENGSFALKIEMDDNLDRMKLLEKLEDALFKKFPLNEFYSVEHEAVNMMFQAEETVDEDLWSFEFNRIAEESEADLSIIGWHSQHSDFSIQQWGGGEYDEGVESNPDAEEYYIGLESGESLKHENLKQSHFDLASYTTESL